jgi:hypothetical protein
MRNVQSGRADRSVVAQFASTEESDPNEAWRDVFELAPVALCVTDPRTLRFCATNRLLRDLLRRTGSELLDMRWNDIADGVDLEYIDHAVGSMGYPESDDSP